MIDNVRLSNFFEVFTVTFEKFDVYLLNKRKCIDQNFLNSIVYVRICAANILRGFESCARVLLQSQLLLFRCALEEGLLSQDVQVRHSLWLVLVILKVKSLRDE